MSYQLLSETTPKARKQFRCIWCPGMITAGERHIHEVSKFDREFQDHRWHFDYMNILALDLGTHTGFAYNEGATFTCGTWDLATPREVREWGKQRLTRRNDPRIARFKEHLMSIQPRVPWDIIMFEDVQFASSTYQVQLWASLRATIWLTFPGYFVDCVPVGTLKKFATGNGNATKEQMEAHLMMEHPKLWEGAKDDNAVDACWLWLWTKTNIVL